MGKSLVIKGANFTESAINEVFSNSQISLDADRYYDRAGVLKNIAGITGTDKIQVPENADVLICSASQTGLQPESIQCFGENNEFLDNSGGDNIGSGFPIGSNLYYLPEGTKFFTYVYDNTYGGLNLHLGLSLTWSFV